MTTLIKSVAAATVHVKDITKARAFYGKTLGLKEAKFDAESNVAYFEVPGSPPLGVHQWGGACAHGPMEGRPPGTVSGIVFNVADAARAATDLKAKGVKITFGPEKMPMGSVMTVFADPDGNEFVLNSGGPAGA